MYTEFRPTGGREMPASALALFESALAQLDAPGKRRTCETRPRSTTALASSSPRPLAVAKPSTAATYVAAARLRHLEASKAESLRFRGNARQAEYDRLVALELSILRELHPRRK